ncbi:MAG: endosialidase [Lachnospiraceae bacterium]|nr:endosialidase [Lachnospiraceae bacterium]MDD3660629.1 endosialidase [Lachnospiraceae bacterium]
MAVVEQLLRSESDGTISFGNHKLAEKAKLEDFEHAGDLYKVKTYKTMTKLEKNGLFVYESVPGTSVTHFRETVEGVSFVVEGDDDAQITIGLEEETEYEVIVSDVSVGKMKTNLGGKLNISAELADSGEVSIRVHK